MEHLASFHDRYPAPLLDWIRAKNWPAFKSIQKRALDFIPIDPAVELPDVILAAETSSGKTEAAFLPLLARVLTRKPSKRRFSVLYVSPLRALINDQYARLHPLGEIIGVPAFRWHSDVSDKEKGIARQAKGGVLLTTPESLEGFVLRSSGLDINRFSELEAVVIDELHAFFENARGRQLQSLLHRIEDLAKRQIPRLGLSATLGPAGHAAGSVLRPKAETAPRVITGEIDDGRVVQIELKSFLDEAQPIGKKNGTGVSVFEQIAEAVLEDFGDLERGLVFCNSRARVETLHERLTTWRKPHHAEFRRHHSFVKRDERMLLEKQMRGDPDADAPKKLVAVCTNSLELGIDIGRVERVGQIEPPFTVAALRQRIGRSGRRAGEPVAGTIYVSEKALDGKSHPLDALRLRTFQAAATLTLALEGLFEAPTLEDLHLSTLVHQVVSLARERKKIGTTEAWQLLVRDGPWNEKTITQPFFARFLETLTEGKEPLLRQPESECWVLKSPSSRIIYTLFSTPPEYSVWAGGKTIGQLPMTVTYRAGDSFVLNGSRWKVYSVNDKDHRLNVTRAASAGAPRFGGSAQAPSGLVVRKMRELYESKEKVDGFVNPVAQQCVREGRAAYKKFGLHETKFLQTDHDVLMFPWCGARKAQTLLLALRREGMRAATSSFAITVENATIAEVRKSLRAAAKRGLGDLDDLAREARQLCADRFDYVLIPYHQRLAFARRFLDGEDFGQLVKSLLTGRDFNTQAKPDRRH